MHRKAIFVLDTKQPRFHISDGSLSSRMYLGQVADAESGCELKRLPNGQQRVQGIVLERITIHSTEEMTV